MVIYSFHDRKKRKTASGSYVTSNLQFTRNLNAQFAASLGDDLRGNHGDSGENVGQTSLSLTDIYILNPQKYVMRLISERSFTMTMNWYTIDD